MDSYYFTHYVDIEGVTRHDPFPQEVIIWQGIKKVYNLTVITHKRKTHSPRQPVNHKEATQIMGEREGWASLAEDRTGQ